MNDGTANRMRRAGLLWFFTLLAVVSTGCTTRPARTASLVLLAVRVADGTSPSAAQVTRIHQAIEPHLVRAGFQFAKNLDSADFVVTATFTPSPVDPNGGHVAITGVEPSPRFRNAYRDDGTPEAKEMRQRLRDIERWEERQARDP